MNKVYARINWENYPSENTPLNESNLNKIDYGLNEVDNRVIELDTTKVSSSALSDNIKSWSIDETIGIITIEKYSGEKVLFDLNIEKIPVSFSLSDDGILTMTTDDGTQFTADIGSMIPVLTFNDSETISVSIAGTGVNKTYSFSIKTGSVTGDMLETNYLSNINVKVAEAEGYANTSSTNATTSGNSATLSESWAVGGTGTRDGENTNNAKYYAEQAAAVSNVEIATTEKAGLVKPDGTTITVDADGTIHGNASVTVDSEFSTESTNPIANSTTTAKFNEVDTALSSHTESISSLSTELGQFSNPNLLINPDFKINQRGTSEYTGAVYTVDRWKSFESDSIITINDGYISVKRQIAQVLENYSDLYGRELTLTIKTEDGVYSASSLFSVEDGSYCEKTISDGEWIVLLKNGTHCSVQYNNTNDISKKIYWMKLELGSLATPFVPPDTATELVKCQRYFERVGSMSSDPYKRFGWCNYNKDNTARGIIEIFPKRVKPTMSINGNFMLASGHTITVASVTNITVDSYNGNNMCVYIESSDGLSTDTSMCELHANNDGSAFIDFDAEIY